MLWKTALALPYLPAQSCRCLIQIV